MSLGTADAPTVEWSAACWRSSADCGMAATPKGRPVPLGSMCIGCRWTSRRAPAKWLRSNRRADFWRKTMRYMLFAILLLAAPLGALALTWDFADGSTSTYGWIAWGAGEPLHSEIIDGVWRIAPVPGRRPTASIELAVDRQRLGPVRPPHPTAAPHTPHPQPSMGNSGWAGPIMPRTEASGRAVCNPIPLNGKKSP